MEVDVEALRMGACKCPATMLVKGRQQQEGRRGSQWISKQDGVRVWPTELRITPKTSTGDGSHSAPQARRVLGEGQARRAAVSRGKNKGKERGAVASKAHVIGRQLRAPNSGQADENFRLSLVGCSFSVQWSVYRQWRYMSLRRVKYHAARLPLTFQASL